ncbi:glycosyltransferase family 4 protein [Candidatus Woesearchaeota archaeon]|nr:glycosyltransferase family 4 protein [Candidatus Woesearchaeota archaeon]
MGKPKFIKIVSAYPGACTDQILPTENYIERKLVIMQQKGFDAEIATLTEKGLPAEQEVHGFKVRRYTSTLSMLWNLFWDKDVKMIHSFLRPFLPSLLAGFLFNKKRIITPSTYILGSNSLIAWISKLCMKRYDRVIAQTPYEMEIYLKEGFDPRKVALLPCAIDYAYFSRKISTDKKSLAAKYGFHEGDFIACTVANFRKFKNIDIILEAFKKFHFQYPKSHLILAGKDMLQSEMFREQKTQPGPRSVREAIDSLGLQDSVTLAGSLTTEEVREVHHLSDVFVNSSDPEAQGIAVYEAAASGIALCLSDIGAFTTVFKGLALYHLPRDAEKLASNLEIYYADKNLRMRYGRELQELMHSWDYPIQEKKFSELYDEVLKE